ncbi:MAG: tetratricopeptide repeat protein [bacterium]|nr:tetratricopeptide repeat protein [bacterium]
MIYNIIPLLLILAAAVVIIFVVTKKFPAVVSLDVDSIPQEKEKRMKHQIISNRLKRNLKKSGNSIVKFAKPVINFLAGFFKGFYEKLQKTRQEYSYSSRLQRSGNNEIKELFSAADDFKNTQSYIEAEKCYIKIISLDSKNVDAFKKLGQLYLSMEKVEEAKATLEHVLKLTKEDSEVYAGLADIAKNNENLEQSKKYYIKSIGLNNENGKNYFNLAEIHESQGHYKDAKKAMQQALKIEPKNPKYLDSSFNLSILTKDKADALDAYKMLKDINPENARLKEMKRQIDDL